MQKVKVAVFPAAGLGTRFLPATKAQPKEMLPLVDRPLIQYVVAEAKAAGIERIVIVTGRGKNAIEDHFDAAPELEALLAEKGKNGLLEEIRSISDIIPVSYVRQKQALGLGHAVLQARDLVGHEPFAVLLGDDIVDAEEPCIGQMMRIYEKRGNPVIALQEVPRSETKHYGIVAGIPVAERLVEIKDMVEKPAPEKAPSQLAIIGRYLLPPEIFRILEETRSDVGGEIQLTSALKTLAGRRPIDGYLFTGRRYDAGDKLGFLKATVELALKRPDLGGPFREYLKGLKL
jgi:UTP--glucose-1-phosphate uridylyltransferase